MASSRRSNKSSARYRPPLSARQHEEIIVNKREKEFKHQQTWGGTEKYYQKWNKLNSKFDEWTSPTYYDSNNKMLNVLKTARDKEESMESRKEKMRKLYEEDNRLWDSELLVAKSKLKPSKNRIDDIPTEILKEINSGLKLDEEIKRKHQAEIGLYHKWRNNNPTLREYERKYQMKDLKLSWLDQQIEKRLQKDLQEEENRKTLKEREERLQKEKLEEEKNRQIIAQRNKELKEAMEKQVEELKARQQLSEQLKQKEETILKLKLEMDEIEQNRKAIEKTKAERELALYNIKQYQLKLKHKARNVQKNLEEQEELVRLIQNLELAEKIENLRKKEDIKIALHEFLAITQKQKELERVREKHLQFVFDSEAKIMFEQQSEIWKQEENSRSKLIQDVLQTLQLQIDENIVKNKEKQIDLVRQRELLVNMTETYDKELEDLKKEDEKKKIERKKELDAQMKLKAKINKQEQENIRLNKINDELEKAKLEEARLKREILNLHRGQGVYRPKRSNIFF